MVENVGGFRGVQAPQRRLEQGPPVESDGDFVKGLYKEVLGREPDLDGYHAHMKALETHKVTRDELRDIFLDSPEFKERLGKLNKLEADANAASTGGVSPQAFVGSDDVPLPPGSPAGAAPAGDRLPNGLATDRKTFPVGPVPLEGYDGGKLNNPAHQTVKYQFGRVASNYPLDGVKDHAGAQALLEKMTPDLKAAGLNIKGVQRDKILVETELGDEWVDVVRGAGSGNPGWWWGSEGKAVPGTAKAPGGPAGPGAPLPGGPLPTEPGAPLATVPMLPEYGPLAARIDKSSLGAATKSAAAIIKSTYPHLMPVGDDRAACYKVMTHVIGILRAAGYDAHRVVNHTSRPEGHEGRYGSDAVVVQGRVFDVYRAMGEASEPVDQDVGAYAAGRLRE